MAHPPLPAGKKEEVGEWGWPDELPSWNWAGREGLPFQVRVFSKAARVRLELNGKPLGERAIDAAHGIVATFDVPYAAGELKATAFDANGAVLGTRVLTTTGKPAAIALTPELERVHAARGEVVYVPIEVRDGAGRLVDDAAVPLTANVSGDAELIAFGSANPATADFAGDDKTESWRGHALLVVRSTGKTGAVKLSVNSPGLTMAEAQFELKAP
jgi:beta-galactosidase